MVYQRISPFFCDYMGKTLEGICKQYLYGLLFAGKLPVEFSALGRFWGTDLTARKQEEIDIMGEADKDSALFAECKWTNKRVDTGVLDKPVARSGMFSCTAPFICCFQKAAP